jgi:CspA family cold shock protein
MPNGRIKWFNADKGFGFIVPEEGGADVFLHITAIEAAGLESIEDGTAVTYELMEDRKGKMAAGNLKRRDLGALNE